MMNNSADDNGWRTTAFRQNVVQKIEETIQKSGTPTSKSSIEMENHVFMKAKNKDEYLGYVARLILHVREMNANKKDPINALRAMAQPASGNQMMNVPQQGGPQQFNNTASNLLQTLNQGRPNLQNRMPGMQAGVMNQMGGSLGTMQQGPMHGGPNMGQVNIGMGNQMNPNVNPSVGNVSIPGGPGQLMNTNSMNVPMAGGGNLSNQMGVPNQIGVPNQMGNSMSGALPGPMGNVINTQMGGGQVQSPMGGGMSHSHMNVQAQINHMAAQRKMVPEGMMIPNQGGVTYIQSRPPVSNAFIRQNTPPPNQSPMQMSQNNMIPSPGLVPSPSPVQLGSAGGLVMRPAGKASISSVMAPSPSSSVSLNTPGGQSQPTPSPLGNEEQAYRDKVKQLSRYIEPLRRMISRLGSGDHEKMSKMKKLLEILSSPGQRITMDILLKCEAVLEKMDIKAVAEMKEQHPLIEAISSALQNPNPNHTFQRTFEPVMSMLNGKPLKNLPRPLKRKYVEEITTDIPEVLQGEVARLDQRFKVSLDLVQQNSSKCIYLLCWLDDRHLPCIPPVQITIPEDYPNSSPKCDMSNYEYGSTKFLEMIQKALQSRISKLPSRYTMSQLLDTWENSVRETCSSDRVSNVDSVLDS